MSERRKKIIILCSNMDKASQNIKTYLLQLRHWKLIISHSNEWKELMCVYEADNFWLIEIDTPHIYQDDLDKKLAALNIDTELIIVASKHKSKDGKKVLTVHFTGNPNNADFGGLPKKLSYPAPFAMKSILLNMQHLADNTDYDISMEATHHGPTEVSIPMVYVEIGSTETEWEDAQAGEIVSKAILDVNQKKVPVAIGFGGGHYALRQNNLVLTSNITFGHNFSNHQLEYVDINLIKNAVEKSHADFIYLDRKALSSVQKEKLTKIAKNLGLLILRENEIVDMGNVPWNIYLYLLKTTHKLVQKGYLRMTKGFKQSINSITSVQSIDVYNFNDEILNKTIQVNREKFLHLLDLLKMAYLENNNGTLAGILFKLKFTKQVSNEFFINECIKILKERYEIKYMSEEMTLYITEDRFDPKLAIQLGVPPGPMFADLKNGLSVTINNNLVEPFMVYRKNTRKIII